MKKPRFSNPWVIEEPEEPTEAHGVQAPAPPKGGDVFDEGTGGVVAIPVTDLKVPSYGGVSVRNAATATEALLKVLDVLIPRLKDVDDVLTQHEVLVAQFKAAPKSGFYVHRAWDGWTLSVPSAQTREQALLQIVQALLDIARSKHRGILEAANITPYRL